MKNINQKISWYITAIGFLGIFSTTLSKNPVLPLFIKGLGGQDYILGIIAAASPFAGIVFSFPIGYLADRIGKKRLLLISTIIFTVSPLLYLFVTNPLLLIPIRFFHGMATAIMGPVASAIIVGAHDENKAEKLGVYSSATLFGRTIAPLVGGFIISYFSSLGNLMNYRLVYVTAFAVSLPVIFLAISIPKDSEQSNVKVVSLTEMITIMKQFLSHFKIISTAVVEMATYYIYGVLEAYLPVFLVTKHVEPKLIGLLFSIQVISIAITKPFFGKLADRHDKRIQIIVGILILTVATISIPYLTHYVWFIGVILLFGLGMSLSTIATNTYVVDLVSKDKQTSALGLLSALMDVGQTLGPFITGFIISSYSYKVGFNIAALVALTSVIFFLCANFSKKRDTLVNVAK